MPTFWGKEEIFWVALQAIFAGFGLLGLFLYVLDTSRMRWLGEEDRRARRTPILSLSQRPQQKVLTLAESVNTVVALRIRNVGEGTAIGLHGWYHLVGPSWTIPEHDTTTFYRPPGALDCVSISTDLMKGEKATVRCFGAAFGQRWLLVLEAGDTHGGKHQFQMLSCEDGKVQVTMKHKHNDSLGEWLISAIRRYLEVVRRLNEALTAFDDES